MINKYIAASVVALLAWMPNALTAKTDYKQNYNYTRAMEFWNKDNDKCKEWMLKEIESCPQNGFAFYRLSALYRREEEYGKALNAANQAVALLKKEKNWNAYSLQERAWVHVRLTDTISALKDLDEAIRISPKEEDFLESRADLLIEMKRYDEAKRDYQKYTELNPGEAMGFACLGHIAFYQENYDEAIRLYDYSNKLTPNYSYPYRLRAEAYAKMGKWRESIDNIITCLQLKPDDTFALNTVEVLADSAHQLLCIKMKAQFRKDPTNGYWPAILSSICQRKELYGEALRYSKDAFDITGAAPMAASLAQTYVMLGMYKEAIDMCNRAYEIDSTNIGLLFTRAQIKEEASMEEEALIDIERYITSKPEMLGGYIVKAQCLHNLNRNDEALEVIETALAYDPDNTSINLLKGKILSLRGDSATAEPILRHVIEKDTDVKSRHQSLYAYLYLQQYDSIDAIQQRVIARDSLQKPSNSNLYNIACLFALRGDTAQAYSYLKRSLDAGFLSFNHARKDPDFISIQQDARFIDLLAEYEQRFAQKQGFKLERPDTKASMEGESSEIPFTKESGVCKVKCTINELPLYFIFDTGASSVSISSVEATFMFKNGYLAASDIQGKEYFSTATGEISEGTIILLRKVEFGGVTLTNVKASVVAQQNAPLLLGQSVLARLGHIEIDNTKKVIRITK